mgnify:CR=1 FL=1
MTNTFAIGAEVRTVGSAAVQRLKDDALALQNAGATMIVLEAIPAVLAAEVTALLNIITIGIGAGSDCDGQVLVLHDMLGWGTAKFTRVFGDVKGLMEKACKEYINAVRDGSFPGKEHQYE